MYAASPASDEPLMPNQTFLRCGSLSRLATISAIVAIAVASNSAAASELRFTPMVRAVAAARPSVVNIHGRKTVRSATDHFGQDEMRQVNGMGTGVVIDERGYVITNYHVIEGVSRLQVTLHNQKTVTATLVAHDPKTDLAVIKIPAEDRLPVLRIGTSSDLMPAEPVVAVGNAYGYTHTVTQGVISELHRSVQVSEEQGYEDLIQTDASINPGNSGGPLLNIDGEMIGLNVAVRVGAQGIGFAIPIDEVMEVAARLLSAERIDGLSHGISGQTNIVDAKPEFVVRSVESASPAQSAGIEAGDVIAEVDGQPVDRDLDFQRRLLGHASGDQVSVKVRRGDETLLLALKLSSAATNSVASADRAWQVLGLRLDIISSSNFERLNSKYRGGMKVTAVRSGGPAERTGIRQGDVLVGILGWETISHDNLKYILNSREFKQNSHVKFYVLRSGETLYGNIHVSHSTDG